MPDSVEEAKEQPGARAKFWLNIWLRWGSLLLLFLTLEIAVRSIEQAQWFSPQPSLTLVLVLAILTGWLLAKSRLHAALTFPIALVAGLIVTVWQGSSLLTTEGLINRVSQFIASLSYSWETISAGKASEGNIHFVVFLVFLTWVMSYVSTWFVLRRRNAWVAVFLGAITILVNLSNLPDQYYAMFFPYLLAAVLLVGQTNLTRHNDWFEKNGVDCPRRGITYSMASLLCLGVVAVSFAWLTPEIRVYRAESLVSTKAAWKKNIEDYFTKLLADIPAKQPFLKSHEQGTLPFGDAFGYGDQPHFVVYSKRPSYWRTQMYDIYNSTGWASSSVAERMFWQGVPSGETERLSRRSEITYNVVSHLRTDMVLNAGEFVSSDVPVLIRTLAPKSFNVDLISPDFRSLPQDVAIVANSLRSARRDREFDPNELRQFLPQDLRLTDIGATRAQSLWSQPSTIQLTRIKAGAADIVAVTTPNALRPGKSYTVTASISTATATDLAKAGDKYPNWVTDYYLQLPANFSEGMRQLAEAVTRGANTPWEKAEAIKRYLAQFRYTLEPKSPPSGVDGVEYFLFVQKTGNCMYFGSATVVMLRSVGVPARLAVGYLPGERNPATGSYTLTAKYHHAWSEIYFPGYGWIVFETTPFSESGFEAPDLTLGGRGSNPYYDEEEDEYLLNEDYNGIPSTPSTPAPGKKGPGMPFFVTILSMALLAAGAWIALQLWFRRFTGPDYASSVYGKVCRLASMARVGPEPQQTPLEYYARLSSGFPLQAEAFGNIVHAYQESRFSPRKKLMPPQMQKLEESWSKVYPVLLKRFFRDGIRLPKLRR
ncbi:MAG: transglutaminase domain-containing protein [Chloroflexi bacterium]|nr:transglutaminase domain-containing protein [Chloroflexota bacterium]